MITDSSVSEVRVFLRNRLARTNRVLVMGAHVANHLLFGASNHPWCAAARHPASPSQAARDAIQGITPSRLARPGCPSPGAACGARTRGLRIVGDHHDRLAVLAIEHLQQ